MLSVIMHLSVEDYALPETLAIFVFYLQPAKRALPLLCTVGAGQISITHEVSRQSLEGVRSECPLGVVIGNPFQGFCSAEDAVKVSPIDVESVTGVAFR